MICRQIGWSLRDQYSIEGDPQLVFFKTGSANPGDYAVLFGNGGAGSIDWNTPMTGQKYDLFPNGAGIYGFGRAPFGHHRFGHGHAMRTAGFGHLPFGRHPFGHGAAVVAATDTVDSCGSYKYAFACYDAAGNQHEGAPDEVEVEVHIAPPAPAALTKTSYNKDTGVLTLAAP